MQATFNELQAKVRSEDTQFHELLTNKELKPGLLESFSCFVLKEARKSGKVCPNFNNFWKIYTV